jgi:hypothetical protein
LRTIAEFSRILTKFSAPVNVHVALPVRYGILHIRRGYHSASAWSFEMTTKSGARPGQTAGIIFGARGLAAYIFGDEEQWRRV